MACNGSSTERLAPARTASASPAWPEVKAWRKGLRREIIAARKTLEREARWQLARAVAEGVRHALPELQSQTVGFYWPIQGELDLRFLVEQWCEAGAPACLPVVAEKQAPVEFWAWRPGMRMQPGCHGADERETANAPASPPCYGTEADPLYAWGPGPPGDIRLKRIHDPVEIDDGTRVLVDRLWPRGVKRESARLHLWLREVAPSPELRRWFKHDPERWPTFVAHYKAELAEREDALARLLAIAREGRLTLLFAARDRDRNHAVVLRDVLLRRLSEPDETLGGK